jgi:hypothetical protein
VRVCHHILCQKLWNAIRKTWREFEAASHTSPQLIWDYQDAHWLVPNLMRWEIKRGVVLLCLMVKGNPRSAGLTDELQCGKQHNIRHRITALSRYPETDRTRRCWRKPIHNGATALKTPQPVNLNCALCVFWTMPSVKRLKSHSPQSAWIVK